MSTSYKNRFQKFSNLLAEPELIKRARHNGSNTLCRNRNFLKFMMLGLAAGYDSVTCVQ